MKMKIFALLTLLSISFAGASAKDILHVGNDVFSSEIVVDGGRILPASLSFRGETVTTKESVPYFEFCVNSCTVTSLSPIWKYAGKDCKTLSNGGVVTTFHFAAKGKFKGLHVLVDRECFPDAAFVRERMRLYSTKPGFKLTNVEGKNHFIFPQYSFSAKNGLSAEQLRIGRFQTKTNLTDNHTFHPDRFPVSVTEYGEEVKGPFVIIHNGDCRIVTSYEHASQDNTFMNEKNVKHSGGNDEMQAVEGDQGFITDDDLWFIATRLQRSYEGGLTVSNRIRRGGYCDREKIPQEGYYETVWSTISLLGKEDSLDEAIQRYLYDRISDHAASRKPVFYYNTWGMQRDQPKEHLKDCITEERLIKDIEYCKEMGIERFIIDDGWQTAMGIWTPNKRLYPNGLGPIIKKIKDAGMEPGLWLSLLALSKGSELYNQHPEWHIGDQHGAPILVQWGNPGMDITGGFYDYLLDSLKKLVDQGIRFFKWDAVSTMSSSNPGLGHGDEPATTNERIDRYNYIFPFYVTRLARELKEYNPDVVVELDLTEHWRCMIGLMTLQEAKFFWINNGASRYGDYSTYRSKSMRLGVNEFAGIFPPEVFTYAVYPMNISNALKYNVHSTIMAGHGFWGNLDKTTSADREYVADQLRKAKKVLPHVEGMPMKVSGKLCDTPEIYTQANPKEGYALMTAFSAESWDGCHHITLDPSKVIGVLDCPFSMDADGVNISLRLIDKDDSAAAYVLGGNTTPVRVLSSTGSLTDLDLSLNGLSVKAAEDAVIRVEISGQVKEISLKAGEQILVK